MVEVSSIVVNDITADAWYLGLIRRFKKSLGLKLKVIPWWKERDGLSPSQRFSEFIEEVLLAEIAEPIVIFIDEIDSLFTHSFNDDFFALLRSIYQERSEHEAYRRLSFVLLGVATPGDLIRDKQRTSFNIGGRLIDLKGFQAHEVEPLEAGIAERAADPAAVLRELLGWTGGQPFLMQRLCRLIAGADFAIPAGQEAVLVEQLVRSRVIEDWEAQDESVHLKTIRDRILVNETKAGRLLGLYQRIVRVGAMGEGVVADGSEEQIELRLSGLIREVQGKLRVANPIYGAVFDQGWINEGLAKLRPYGREIEAWLGSGQRNESWLLRGQALGSALAWSQGKLLADDDRRFLLQSQALDNAEQQAGMQTQLEAEAEANRILTEARAQAEAEKAEAEQALERTRRQALEEKAGAEAALAQTRRQARAEVEQANVRLAQTREETEQQVTRGRRVQQRTSLIAAGAIAAATAASFWGGAMSLQATNAQQKAEKVEKKAEVVQQKADTSLKTAQGEIAQIQQQMETATEQLSQAQEKAKAEQAKVKQAEAQLTEANQKQKQANQQAAAAAATAEAAQQKSTEAEQQSAAASQKASEAEQLAQTAQGQLTEAEGKLDDVETKRQAAEQLAQAAKQAADAAKAAKQEAVIAQQQAEQDTQRAQATLATVQQEAIDTQRSLARARTGLNLEREAAFALRKHGFEPLNGLLLAMETGQSLYKEAQKPRATDENEYPAYSPILALDTMLRNTAELNQFTGHQDWVRNASFSPDGERIVTASDDNTARLWDIPNFDSLLDNGCTHLSPYLINHPEKLEKLTTCQTDELKIMASPAFVRQGDRSASQGEIELALEQYQKALTWNPNLSINPTQRAQKESAPFLVRQAIEVAYSGDIDHALEKIRTALKFNPELSISARNWNSLCWDGSISGAAQDVLFACEQAVSLAPRNTSFIDSRGLARALTGDIQGAIDDFQTYVSQDGQYAKQRSSWIQLLKTGQNPFTPEILEAIKNQ